MFIQLIVSSTHGDFKDSVSKSKTFILFLVNKVFALIKVLEDGALFKSYIDGSNQLLSPEKSIQIQRDLGADLIVVFDECTPFNVDKDYTYQSMLRSHRWAKRSINAFHSQILHMLCPYGLF